jgi:2-octaprenyl-6-methoxyphenol hydroxylase
VGAALGALAANAGLDIAIFEARAGPAADGRTLALSHGSREYLEEARAWPRHDVTPIHSIHISQKGGPGRTVLDASEQSLPALGYTVPFATLERALGEALAAGGRAPRYGETCESIALGV